MNILDGRLGPLAALAYGAVLVGWILGELVLITHTIVLTWLILGAGAALIVLAAPGVMSLVRARGRRQGGQPAA